MERFGVSPSLTTSEVADLLGVHASTVKRWCDDGELPTGRTGGGHRRIALGDAVEFARERDIDTFLTPFHPHENEVWNAVARAAGRDSYGGVHDLALGWLARGHVARVGRLFAALGRHPALSFESFCDEGVRGFMRLVGDAWREGRLRVGEEHMASQALVEALLAVRGATPVPDAGSGDGPVALVGSMEGDQHHLGALCVRMLLERLGWQVYYLGPAVPVEDFAAIQRSVGARLVCVSFSSPLTGADVLRCVRVLQEFYAEPDGYGLALGGDLGGMPALDGALAPFRALATFSSCGAFREALENGFATRSQDPR